MGKIEFKNASLRYNRKFYGLKDVSFTIEGDKIVGLIGRNGAGKTSLLSLLAAFRRPTEGSVLVNDEAVYENAKAMEQIAFLWDKSQTEEAERVKFHFERAAMFRPNWDMEYALKLSEMFGLDLKKKVNKLSRGMQSAMNVTIGLASRAPVTIFDEAYLGMDAPNRKLFYTELLKDYVDHPRTIIFSTHYIGEVEHMFEEVVMLHEGRLIAHDEIENLKQRGIRLVGGESAVKALLEGKQVLSIETLGNTMAAVILGDFDEDERQRAEDDGIEFDRPSLQDLFIHMTDSKGGEINEQ